MTRRKRTSFLSPVKNGELTQREEDGIVEKAKLKLLGRRSDFEALGGHRKTTAYIYERAWVDFGLFLRFRFGDGVIHEWTATDRDYRAGVSAFVLAYLEESLEEVETTDIEAYVAALLNKPTKNRYGRSTGVSNSTINLRLAALNYLFKIAIREGVRDTNPANADAVDRRKPRRNPKPFRLEREDIQAMINYLEEGEQTFRTKRDAMMLRFLFLTGCRRDELVRLTVDDLVDMGKKGVAVNLSRKGDVKQNILLTQELEQNFVTYINELNPSRFLFPRAISNGTATDQPMSPNRVTEMIEKLSLEVLGRRHSPHDFRHSFCTMALEAGAPIHTVQSYLGHSDPKTTMIYFDSVLSREGSAAEFVSLKEE